jgi:hypothetical protein
LTRYSLTIPSILLIDVSNAVRKSLTWCTSHLPMHGRLNTFPTYSHGFTTRLYSLWSPNSSTSAPDWVPTNDVFCYPFQRIVVDRNGIIQNISLPGQLQLQYSLLMMRSLFKSFMCKDSDRRLNVDSKHKKLIAMPYLRPELDEWVSSGHLWQVLFFLFIFTHVSSNLLVVL